MIVISKLKNKFVTLSLCNNLLSADILHNLGWFVQ